MPAENERHQPLPPLPQLPGYLWRRTPRAGRAVIVLLGVGAVVAIVLSVPGIRESKRETAARERTEAADSRARRIRELRRLQAPRSATSANVDRAGASVAERVRTRRALARDLSAAIVADSRRRPGTDRVRRADCRGLAPEGRPVPERDLVSRRGRYACTAVTSDIRSSQVRGSIGYPYRAIVDYRNGRLVWCRDVGQAGEGGYIGGALVPISARCGG